MNLLVTNTHFPQAYSIILALRPYSTKIVATMSGRTWLQAKTSQAAHSRYVDKRCDVPSPEEDWLAGNVLQENTANEEAYISRIEEICRTEKIGTIFPSYDPDVYVLAKNKQRLEELGVLLVAPDHCTVAASLDKYESIKAARRAGFPCPKTLLPRDVSELEHVSRGIGPPWVVKPRFTAGSLGTKIVAEPRDLLDAYLATSKTHYRPMVQEFIPGSEKQNFYLVADRESGILDLMCPRVVRISKRIFRNSSAACIVSCETPYLAQLQALVRELRWWGGLTVQAKVDARDGTLKLMEVNPRLGTHLWYRTESGVNVPYLCFNLAAGRTVSKTETYREGAILLDPIEDLLGFSFELLDLIVHKARMVWLGHSPTDEWNPPPPLASMLRQYKNDYMSTRQKIFSPFLTQLLHDPLPCLLRYYAYLGHLLRGVKDRGK